MHAHSLKSPTFTSRLAGYCLAVTVLMLAHAGVAVAQVVSQTPLSAGGNVPGNLLLVPSVEWPTIDSLANIATTYSTAEEYTGYFDSGKCYKYNYSSVETDRYFYPVSTTATRTCSYTNKEWSGNFLNWAATQTIDPFRKALTGGYRTTDTATTTILEKARSDANTGSSIFPDRRLPNSGDNSAVVRGATPADWLHFNSRVRTFGNRMRFSSDGDVGTSPTAYDPSVTLASGNKNTVFEVSIRVQVCLTGLLEDNCVVYGSNAKPEGLIQKYSNRIRYSAFGYLNDHSLLRDGGVLRARQKFVGPMRPDPATGISTANPAAEWSSTTGVLVQNPDTADATTTTAAVGLTINNSGVINYVNKFGQMTTKNHKSYDPVSELYYTALRYLRHVPNISAYTNLGAGDANSKYEFADGFPVITDWDDPYQYWCQNSAILGIGDVNTHRDKDLKGTTRTVDEPGMPSEVGAETVDVNTWTQKIAALESITINTPFTGRENSAYMAGLAYWAHTQDLRTETTMPNKQTVSTHWVDVREAQVLEPKNRNQYWLAAKYGGFTVPKDYDSNTNVTALDPDWWYTNGEDLDPSAAVYPRADNFYVASDADKMVDSLTRAFAKIGSERIGSGASLAANSTRLDTQTRTFQAQFRNLNYGQINSFSVNPTDGSLSTNPVWTAGTPIADPASGPIPPGTSLARANWASRNIWVNANGSHVQFRDTNLTAGQKSLLTFVGMPTSGVRATTSAHIVDYLRGSNAREESETNGSLRTRLAPETGWSPILGDIVNSTPVFVGAPSPTLYSSATFNGASSYNSFALAQASRLGVLYVGGNDGMLHSFDAATGKEVYAFIPDASISRGIGEFANPEFDHRYFVDGDLAIADVWNGAAWRTVLVGTMGRGGPGIFALDITNPLSPTLLWEKSATQIATLGKNIGRPVIAQVANGDWRVILGNGPDSATGAATLVMIGVTSGTITVKDTLATGSNGLSAVLARDTDADGFADTAYAGDLRGTLWKFTSLGSTPAVTSLFSARDPANVRQPITAAPTAAKDPATGTTWVFFGTGLYLNSSDLVSTQRQTWYGIKDNGVATTRGLLVARTFTDSGALNDFSTVRTLSVATTGDMTSAQGWYIDLPASGERIVVPNRFQGNALIGTSRIPTLVDVCQPTGRGFVMAIDPFSGARLSQTFFDTNHDGVFNSADTVNGEVVSAIGFDSSANNPIFVENVMQVGLDDGSTRTVRTQGTNVDASRMSWREIIN
jgi:type IV pilus assembly protein PilY1